MARHLGMVSLVVVIFYAACGGTGDLTKASAGNQQQLELGAGVFANNCAVCHGEKGVGGVTTAPPLDSSAHAWHHPDLQIKEWIADGKFGPISMPAYGARLTEADMDAVVVYLKTLWTEEQRRSQEDVSRRYERDIGAR